MFLVIKYVRKLNSDKSYGQKRSWRKFLSAKPPHFPVGPNAVNVLLREIFAMTHMSALTPIRNSAAVHLLSLCKAIFLSELMQVWIYRPSSLLSYQGDHSAATWSNIIIYVIGKFISLSRAWTSSMIRSVCERRRKLSPHLSSN